jgi:hypothetical protein
MALTDTAIRGTKPGQKPFKIYDRDGLFLLVNPGGSKLWRWRYHFDGKEKLMALGEYPLVNLGQARELHFAARKTLATGIDRMVERKAEADAKQRETEARQREAENSFENVARMVVYGQVPASCRYRQAAFGSGRIPGVWSQVH